MPDWLPKLLVQFPAVVVMGGIFWYAARWLARQNDRELARAGELYANNLADARRSHAESKQATERMLTWLRDDLRQEVRAVGRKLDGLARKLS